MPDSVPGSGTAVDTRDDNIIVLDDVTSVRQRVLGGVILLLLIAVLVFPIGREFDATAESEATRSSSERQTVLDMCGPWRVPDALESVAHVAYPGWSWICRLVQP